MILRKGTVCQIKDTYGLDFCEEGELCVFVDDVITVDALLGTFNFRKRRAKVLNQNRVEIICHPIEYKVGDKVYVALDNAFYSEVVFTIQKEIGFNIYSVQGADLSIPVARHELIPTTLANRHNKSILLKGD